MNTVHRPISLLLAELMQPYPSAVTIFWFLTVKCQNRKGEFRFNSVLESRFRKMLYKTQY